MVLVAILAAFLLLGLVTKHYGHRLYRRAALLAFSGHLFISLAIIPRLPYSWDISYFHRVATEIATGAPASGSATVSSFAAFQALLYTLFAPQPQTLAVFNGLLAVLIVIPASYLTSSLYPENPRKNSGVMLGILFLPLPFLFLSIPMRDALTVLLFFTLLAVILHALQASTPVWSLPAIPLWGMLYLVRPELSFIVILGVVAGSVVRLLRIIDPGLSLLSLTLVLGSIGCLGFGLFANLLYSFEQLNGVISYRSTGGAGYLTGMTYHSWFDFLLAAPARGIYFQFAPFPLQVESVFHLLAFLGSLVVIVLCVSAVRSLYDSEYNEVTAVFLVVVYLTGIVGYGTIDSNFGTNIRHRIPFDFLLIVFASPVLHQWWLRAHEWVSMIPSYSDDGDEQKRKAQKLHRRTHCRQQNPDDTQQ